MTKSSLAALLLGVVLLVLGPLRVAQEISQQHQNDDELRHDGSQLASTFNSYFERARALDLLLSQNPDLLSIPTAQALTPEINQRANHALQYVETLYPAAVGEACLIDETGAELARVTKGVPAPMDALSSDEADNAFFRGTLALQPGEVYQAAPYVSADTGEWVISNSTPVRVAGHTLIVHFEVSLSSFAMQLYAGSAPGRHAAVLDATTGHLVLQENGHLPSPTADFPPFPHWSAIDGPAGTGPRTVSVDGRALAVTPIHTAGGAANRWVVVNWIDGRSGFAPIWLGVLTTLAGALLLLLLVFALRHQHGTLRRAARLDHLTGMANRKALEEALDDAVVAATRDHERVGVMLLDLDGFKQINDTLGHDSGDVVLQEIGRRLHANTFEYDTAARLGGDEYAVVLRHLNDDIDATAVGHRLRDALIRPIEIDGVSRLVGVSIGVAVCPDHGTTRSDLLRAADASMYRAKRSREGVSVYEAGTAEGAQESWLAAELLMAIEQDEIQLVFQPEHSLETGRIVTVEALARWQRADGTSVPPSTFVPLAEEIGLIRPLTQLTLRKALDELVVWRGSGIGVPVSVNLSGALVSDRTLPALVASLLRERGLAGDSLILEITETAAISRVGVAREVLHDLRALGVRIELDDFGSGYASARTLRDIPLDGVKVDRDLVNDLTPTGRNMLATTIELGKVLQLYVVAEGIEDECGLDALRSLGADVVQGFHLGRPMAPEQIRSALAGDTAELDRSVLS